uniref:Uncharacterized protein n=1 Tax=viral metagenome TaxID=1070528 RepID=A0A6C0JDP4_9ZZZZ
MTTNDSEINISDTTLDDLKTNYYASLKSAFQLVSSTSLPTTYYSQIIEETRLKGKQFTDFLTNQNDLLVKQYTTVYEILASKNKYLGKIGKVNLSKSRSGKKHGRQDDNASSPQDVAKRESYYYSQELHARNAWLYLLFFLYVLVFCVFFISILSKRALYSLQKRIAMIVCFLSIPYVSYHYIIPVFIRGKNIITTTLPPDVYL